VCERIGVLDFPHRGTGFMADDISVDIYHQRILERYAVHIIVGIFNGYILRTRLARHVKDCKRGIVVFDEVQKVAPGTLDGAVSLVTLC
jgi:hypothetical protein